MVAGLIAVFAAKSKSARVLGRGKPGFGDPAGGAAFLAVVALGQQQLGQERPVGQLLAGGGVGELAVAVPQRRQPQQPGRGVDRRRRSACSLGWRPVVFGRVVVVLVVVVLVMRASFR